VQLREKALDCLVLSLKKHKLELRPCLSGRQDLDLRIKRVE